LVNRIRVYDTRSGAGGSIGFNLDGSPLVPGPLTANATRRFLIGGRSFGAAAIPGDVTGALLNVTAVQGGASGGYVTAFSGDVPAPPNASTLNPSTTVAASFWANGLPSEGAEAVFSTNALDLVVDLVGYFRPPAG